MHTVYADRILRAVRQAPWRAQTQIAAAWSISLLVFAVLGGFYLATASRAGAAGRDLQNLEITKAQLMRANDEMRAQLASLRSVQRLGDRARALGFVPANPEEVEYLTVANYPPPAAQPAASQPAPAAATASLGDWWANALRGLTAGGG